MIEFNPLFKKYYNIDPMNNMKFLAKFGFQFYDMHKDILNYLDFDQLFNTYNNEKKITDFLCVKN